MTAITGTLETTQTTQTTQTMIHHEKHARRIGSNESRIKELLLSQPGRGLLKSLRFELNYDAHGRATIAQKPENYDQLTSEQLSLPIANSPEARRTICELSLQAKNEPPRRWFGEVTAHGSDDHSTAEAA